MIELHTITTAPSLVFDARAGGPAGAPMLLPHGFAESLHTWCAQLPALAQAGYRAVASEHVPVGTCARFPRLRMILAANRQPLRRNMRSPSSVGDFVADQLNALLLPHLVAHPV